MSSDVKTWHTRLGLASLPLFIVGLFGSILGFVPDLAGCALVAPALVWFGWGRIARYIP